MGGLVGAGLVPARSDDAPPCVFPGDRKGRPYGAGGTEMGGLVGAGLVPARGDDAPPCVFPGDRKGRPYGSW